MLLLDLGLFYLSPDNEYFILVEDLKGSSLDKHSRNTLNVRSSIVSSAELTRRVASCSLVFVATVLPFRKKEVGKEWEASVKGAKEGKKDNGSVPPRTTLTFFYLPPQHAVFQVSTFLLSFPSNRLPDGCCP